MAKIILGKPKVKSSKRSGIRDMYESMTPEQKAKHRKALIRELKRRKQAREMRDYKGAMGKHGGYA